MADFLLRTLAKNIYENSIQRIFKNSIKQIYDSLLGPFGHLNNAT